MPGDSSVAARLALPLLGSALWGGSGRHRSTPRSSQQTTPAARVQSAGCSGALNPAPTLREKGPTAEQGLAPAHGFGRAFNSFCSFVSALLLGWVGATSVPPSAESACQATPHQPETREHHARERKVTLRSHTRYPLSPSGRKVDPALLATVVATTRAHLEITDHGEQPRRTVAAVLTRLQQGSARLQTLAAATPHPAE